MGGGRREEGTVGEEGQRQRQTSPKRVRPRHPRLQPPVVRMKGDGRMCPFNLHPQTEVRHHCHRRVSG